MSDSPESTNMESRHLPGWTLVNTHGEIMSGDEDSESSESSIEVLSIEGNEIVSCRLQREKSSEQVEVVVSEDTPSTHSASEETNFSLQDVADFEKAEFSSAFTETAQKTGDIQEAILNSDISETKTEISVADSLQTDSTLSESSRNQEDASRNNCIVFPEQGENCLEDGITVPCAIDSEPAVAYVVSVTPSKTDFDHTSVEESVAADCLFQVNTKTESLIVGTSADLMQFTDEISRTEVTDKVDFGACCMELLLDDSGDLHNTDLLVAVDAKCQQLPAPVSLEEASILQVLSEGTAESSHSSRTDSDTDSDFVRLDTENIEDYAGQNQNNAERVVIPLRLYRTGSSIGPSFSFMRSDERNDQVPQNEDPTEAVDQDDRDDDTESSTEENIDDRIESEQSEVGSLSAQNDVGDLSVFADIGDLPLVAGDVPRNYIHRPNNHLSTVLNIIVVLVAILTMGISLGIIMATDLEIEEWQNAHEFQTRRVNQLEILLKSKTNSYELQLSRVKELEHQLIENRDYLLILERRANNYERAFDALAAQSSLEGETFEKVLHTVSKGVKTYVQCQEESLQLVAVDCHLKLLPYVRNYTALIKNGLSGDKTINLEPISLGKESYDSVDVRMPSQDTLTDSQNLIDRHEPHYEENVSFQQEVYHTDSRKVHFDSEKRPDGGALSQKLDALKSRSESGHDEALLQKSRSESDGRSEDRTSRPSSEFSGHRREKATKETVRASPVVLDIRQLQQSLTREQERALHWQQLYLSERRQRERERENEEWEDEREREMAEREREQMDHVECLRKLMSANLTTLTQHVVKWNVSVFDDFANLSVLLSGISDLQQAVIDSVQRVWKSAEEVIDSFQGKDSASEEKTWESTVPRKEVIIEYLGQLADRVKRADMPDHEVLVEYLSKMLDHVKHGVEDMLGEVYTESVTDSVHKMWENAGDVMKGFHNHKETIVVDGEKVGSTIPDREHLLVYLSKVMNDICPKDNTAFETNSVKLDNKGLNDIEGNNQEVVVPLKDRPSEFRREFSHNSHDDPHLESQPYGPHMEEEESNQHGFWSRRIGKMLKKTGKTVRKLGRKVVGTWDKLKTMWREKKPLWHKIKNIWQEKKSVVFNAGDKFASTVMKASSKFAKICKKMSANWFKTTDKTEVDIHTKCVYKLRKHWQKMVLKDPCHIVGKFSYECNSDKKQCKSDLYKITDSFSHLLNVPNLRRDQILKLNTNDVKVYYNQFKSFQDQWGKSKLLLKTDIGWVDCQVTWWSVAVAASKRGSAADLNVNRCNTINLAENFYEGHHGITFGPDISCGARKFEKDDEKTDDFHSQKSSSFSHLPDVDDHEEEEEDHSHNDNEESSTLDNDETEINETTSAASDSSDLFQEHLKHHRHLSKDKEKAGFIFEQATKREQQKNKVKEDDHQEFQHSYWMFERAKDRERLRKESEKSFWLFERAGHRRDLFRNRWMEDNTYDHQKKGTKKSDDWFMKQAEERRKIREDEHKSDWLFERAANRKKNRDDKYKSTFMKHGSKNPEFGKQFRHTYGKVSTP